MEFWIAIFLFVLGFTFLAYWRPSIVTASVGALWWLLFWAYTRNNPLPGTVTGDFVDQIVYYGSFLMMVGVFFIYLSRRNKERQFVRDGFRVTSDGTPVGNPEKRIEQRGIMEADTTEYRARMHARIHKNDRQRR
jgi:hypothetical protein